MSKLLIGTLYSGENEFEECLSSLKSQNFKNWDHFVLEGLPNKDAHEQLYDKFMASCNDYDLFLKLDADMVFVDNHVLEKIVNLFTDTKDLDHGEFAVKDWYSDSLIMGVHVTTSRATWEKTDDQLFVDPYPRVPGKRVRQWDGIAPFILHSPNPSPFQAYHFGVHRALKAFQFKENRFNNHLSKFQWEILRKTWANFFKTRDRRLGFVILGAEHVIQRYAVDTDCDYTNHSLLHKFNPFEEYDAERLYKTLWIRWNNFSTLIRRNFVVGYSRVLNKTTW